MRERKICFSILMVFSILVVFAENGFASLTRTRTMGDVTMIIRDDANLWIFPATICSNANLANFELGGNSELLSYYPANYGFDKSAGGIITCGKSRNSKIGTFWSETVSHNSFLTYPSSTGNTDSKLDLLYGKPTKDGAIGMHFEHHADLYKTTSGDNNSKISNTRSRLDIGQSTNNRDLAFGYQLTTYYNKAGSNDAQTIYNHHLNLSYRRFRNVSETLLITPFITAQLELEKNNINHSDGIAGNIWAGCGTSYLIDEHDLIVLGLSAVYSHTILSFIQQDKTTINLDLPFIFGGFESKPVDWLALRFGFQKKIQRSINITKNNNSENKTDQTQAPFAATAGIGLKYKRLEVDYSYNLNFLRRGPYFLSGEEGNLGNLISIKYTL